ncbi:MAG TPA: DUF255 domain-containing protein [Saprospiraceae bacterium]|nr:DUF255 domain-containing protein [Saprospiraceae bacterium]HRX28486.1 DUF255 domain-containing protein [Saprospiraceae bacterium]
MKMKLMLGFFAMATLSLFSFKNHQPKTEDGIQWMTWEEAVMLNAESPKKIFVDVYTDWCGWCKRMDKNTFSDPEIIKYMNENFYAVKLNAEQKEDIVFNGNTFKFVENGKNGFHELAYSLLDGSLGFPTMVILDENFSRILLSPGYKEAHDLMTELQFSAGEYYKKTSFDEFQMGGGE